METELQITKELKIIGTSLYLKKHNALAIADVHIGYEESLNKQGILIPRLQFQQTMKRLDNLINLTLKTNKQHRLDLIIINGDLKHEFGTISETEWRQTLKFLDFLAAKTKKIILIKGNHDTIIKPIAEKRNIEIAAEFMIGDYYFCHGDKIPKTEAFKKAKTIIIGHEHPAITFKMDSREERFKCFLFGRYMRKNLIVLPAFNPLVEGTDVLEKNHMSPFLRQSIKNFEVYVVSEKILHFKKVKDIEKVISNA